MKTNKAGKRQNACKSDNICPECMKCSESRRQHGNRTVCSLTRMECSTANKGDKTSSRSVAKAAAVRYK